jgi:hypothetical protein
MNFNNYPEYASIAKHIHRAHIGRAVALSEGISGFIVDCWNAIKAPPAAPAILPIDRRRESRNGIRRNANRFAHR